jgi:hypothetical protein
MQANPYPSVKYPLTIVEVLLEVFGEGIGGGYDIGCKFGTTLNRSKLGPRARALNYKALFFPRTCAQSPVPTLLSCNICQGNGAGRP